MRLTASDVETAFVGAAREQENGEPFNWARVAELLNRRIADRRYERQTAFLLGAPDEA